jgi:type II secretory pathway pseudopilin PulG
MNRLRARRLGSQEGFALMEVIVSAAVLVVVVLGVLAGLDSVTRTAANNQGRTVAATLAEKDLERLRAYKTSDLNQLEDIEEQTRTVTVGKTKWRITSRAEWVTDSDGEEISCAITGDKGSYLKISSSVVADSAPQDAEGLTLSSIVAPQPGKGTLTALVKDRSGGPVVGMPVEAVGPTPGTRPTNAAGCAVFEESEAGSYKLRLNYSGWVDPDGNQLVEKSGTVSAGNLTTVEFIYDRAGSFPVSVVTRRPGDTIDRADRSTGAIAAHTGVSSGYRAMTANSPGVTSFTFNSMFPFSTPYQVYSGECSGNNPAAYIPTYFDTRPLAVAQVNPGAAGPTRVVLEPAIDVTVTHRNSSGVTSNANGADIYAYPKTDDCPTGRIYMGRTNSTGRLPNSNSQQGPGLPFGDYDICVQFNNGSRLLRMHWSAISGAAGPTISNTDPAGVARTASLLSSGSNTSGCGTLTPTTS